ncbi:MAG TPA: NAD(P)/FAD-dependent oxidoreductase [Acidimicrobiia bacterium]|nr:NAD(P)/FAD-dependent oxidoreductase [Acidimicrobiia bacterium]
MTVQQLPADQVNTPELDAVVVGAGFAGLYALYRLRDVLGMRVQAYEAGSGVGGTWFWNRYPGARCDSESFYYCYSFDEELAQEWEWSGRYPEQPEIERYLNHVADRFDLRRSIQFETRVQAAWFDDDTDTWEVRTDRGDVVRARFLVTAAGCLSAENVPDIPGLDGFRGDVYLTAKWPREGVDLRGKRVGLIGTGSSGIQATPVIAAEAEHLTVFQRTPNYSVPARHAAFDPQRQREIKRNYAAIFEATRRNDGGFPYTPIERATMDATPEEREEIFESLWKEGGFKFIWGGFSDVIRDLDANQVAADFIRNKIRGTVKDPATAEMLCPKDHPFGSKRPPIDTDYFETFNRDNVTLVDIRSTPIEEITPSGIRTSEAHYDLDVIVFATGFDAVTGALLRIDIRGANGRRLADQWKDGPRTLLGLQVAGFPNMFTVTGPGSPSILTNVPVAIEHHVEWISDCIAYMREHGYDRVEADEGAQNAWAEHVAEVAKVSIFSHANSWYVGANIPGKPRVILPYCGGMVAYRQLCDEVVRDGYRGFRFARSGATAGSGAVAASGA